MYQYEAMFLFDPTFGSSFENCEKEIRRLMERAQAEIVFCREWDERRLAYRIKGRKRGVYVLVYFKAPSDKIAPLERDAQLSEPILRLLVLRADGVTLDLMEEMVPGRGEVPARSGSEAPRVAKAATAAVSDAEEVVAAHKDDAAKERTDEVDSALAEPVVAPPAEGAAAEPE